MRLPFSSLRANLIAAFVAIIALSLLLAVGSARADDSPPPAETLVRYDAPKTIVLALAPVDFGPVGPERPTTTFVLLLDDRGLVLRHPGQPVRRPHVCDATLRRDRPSVNRAVSTGAATRSSPSSTRSATPVAGSPTLPSSLPNSRTTNAWRDVLPRASMAALLSLLVSIVIAWWLAGTPGRWCRSPALRRWLAATSTRT
jgi:hypothetical protein